MLTENSDYNAKEDITPIDPTTVLQTLVELPLSTWSYRKDPGVRHLGPMAQDFHDRFGLGESPTGIATLDTSGVALAAIQALAADNAAKEARIAHLEVQLAELEAVVAQLAAQRPGGDH